MLIFKIEILRFYSGYFRSNAKTKTPSERLARYPSIKARWVGSAFDPRIEAIRPPKIKYFDAKSVRDVRKGLPLFYPDVRSTTIQAPNAPAVISYYG